MKRFPRRITVVTLALLAVPLGAGRTAASVSPDAAAVVEHYVRAVGGTAAVRSDHSAHLKGTLVSGGLDGTVEAWWREPDRVAVTIALGRMVVRRGYDGVNGWYTNPSSGRVARIDGRELEALRADLYFMNDGWLLSDQGGGRITYGNTVYSGKLRYQVLLVTPPVGPPRRLWFNAKTGLLERVVSRDDHHVIETRLSGYRKLAGRLRATVTESGDPGEPAGYERATLDSIWVNRPLDSLVFAPPETPTSNIAWLKATGVAQMAFRYGRRHIWLKASINGAPPADFLLDTGASLTVIDSAYAARLHLVTEGALLSEGMGSQGSMSFSHVRTLRVAGNDGDGVRLKDVKVGVIDLGDDFESVFWRRAAGLLGYDFISRFVSEIDYDRQVLTLYDPSSFHYAGSGAAIPMGLASSIPTVSMKVNGRCEGTFRLDVGSSSTVDIFGSLVRRCSLYTGATKRQEMWGLGFGGGYASTLCRLKQIEIGPYGWSDPQVALSLHDSGGLASQDYAGNIGNRLLERFKCTFDYERGFLYLEPGARYGQRDEFSRAGIEFLRVGNRVVTTEAVPGSPAEQAGLKANDVVTAIDGKPALSYSAEDLDRMFDFGAAGSTHVITVDRMGEKTRHEMTLRDSL